MCILVCGPSERICDQYISLIINCLKVVGMFVMIEFNASCSIESDDSIKQQGYSIPSNGWFEKHVYMILKEYSLNNYRNTSIVRICDIIGNALLQVPLTLMNNSNRNKFSVAELMKSLKPDPCSKLLDTSEFIEPLHSKIVMLLHSVTLLQQLLRIHAIVNVKKIPMK